MKILLLGKTYKVFLFKKLQRRSIFAPSFKLIDIISKKWYNIKSLIIERELFMNRISDFFKENLINRSRAKKVIKTFEKDRNGNIIIKDGTFVISNLNTDNYKFTNGWILISQQGIFSRDEIQGTMALIKSYIPDMCPGFYLETEAEILRANNFIMPEIAKQFELETAEYYNVIFENCEELHSKENHKSLVDKKELKIKPNQRYLLTPSFKKYNEKLIHLAEILPNEYDLNSVTIYRRIKQFLKSEKVVESDIDKVLKSFIKQSIFNKFIGFSDEHNYNTGLLISSDETGKRARLAPCYDLDFSGDVYNITCDGIQPRAFLRNDGKYGRSLTDILELFYTRYEAKYLKEIIPKINIEKAIKSGEKNGGFKLSKSAKERYLYFFIDKKNELKKFREKKLANKKQKYKGYVKRDTRIDDSAR